MLLEQNNSFHPQVGPLFEVHGPSNGEVHWPIGITTFGSGQQFQMLVSLGDQFRTKELSLFLSSFVRTVLSEHLHSTKAIFPSDVVFDKGQEKFVKLFLEHMVQFSIANLLIVIKFVVKLIPIVNLDSLVCIGLKYLHIIL